MSHTQKVTESTLPNRALGESNAMEHMRKRVEALGITMHGLFRETKQDQAIISRWRYKEPKAIKVLRELDRYLSKLEAGK